MLNYEETIALYLNCVLSGSFEHHLGPALLCHFYSYFLLFIRLKVAVKPSLAGRGRTQRRRPSLFAAPSDVSGKFVNKRRSGPAVALVHTSCFTSPDCHWTFLRCFLKICVKKGQKRNRNYLKCFKPRLLRKIRFQFAVNERKLNLLSCSSFTKKKDTRAKTFTRKK